MAQILAIGVATLDVINTVDGYPRENDKIRACSRHRVRGGNAANTLVVLSRLGHDGAWAGTLASDEAARTIREDLERHGIDHQHCRIHDHGASPTSYVIHNRRNGSRTIVHYRELEEFSAADFRHIDLAPYDWCHFEGRNVPELAAMLALAGEQHPELPLSLEVEKPRPAIEDLF
ncbi:MAG: PfkB family carbohydrate kinase, partial [Gammaproteobacteria bacterium]